MNQQALNRLKEDLKELIAVEVPLNCQCPHCEAEIDPSCIIDATSKTDAAGWDLLVVHVIQKIIPAIPNLINEEV